MKGKSFIFPPRAIVRNNEHAFEGNPMFTSDTHPQELRCVSKIKTLGRNINSSNITRKNLVRCKMQCSMRFKNRAIYAFSALDKDQKDNVLENVKDCSCQCSLPLCPKNNVEHAYLVFGSNTTETNHYIALEDKIESHVDHMLPS